MKKLWVVAIAVLVTIVGVRVAQAGPADGDPSFGNGGVHILDSAFSITGYNSVAVRADGQALAAGTAAGGAAGLGVPLVTRLKADGTLNSAVFGGDGLATTPAATSTPLVARAVAFSGEAALLAGDSTTITFDQPPSVSLLLERVLENGSLDTTFNSTGPVPGRLVTKLGAAEAGARAVHRLADGRILVAGFIESGGVRKGLVARFLSDGRLDPTFSADRGTGGYEVISLDGTSVLEGLALDSAGRILVAGTLTRGTTPLEHALVARLLPTGALDTSFASTTLLPGATYFTPASGKATTLEELAVDASDRPVLVGASALTGPGRQLFVSRLTTAGAPDSAFSPDAPAAALGQAPPNATGSVATGVTIDGEGRITVAGETTAAGLRRFLLARYTSDGAFDTSFASGGNLVLKAIGSGDLLEAGLSVRTDGRVLVAGQTSVTSDSTKAFAARFGAPGLAPLPALTASWPDVAPGNPKNAVRPGQTVTFDSSGSTDADGTIVQREWDLDGNGSFELAGGETRTRAYSQEGDVGVTVRLTDDEGLTALATQAVRVRANAVPDAIPGVPAAGRTTPRPQPLIETGFDGFTGASTAEVVDPTDREFVPLMGRRYAFTGAPSTDRDGKVEAYRWALDVNGKYTEWTSDPEIEHIFWVPGKRTIRLQVRDDEGAVGTWEREVDVPAPKYSLQLLSEQGYPHPGLVLKPGGPAGRVIARIEVTNNGWLDGIKAASIASADGQKIDGLIANTILSVPGRSTHEISFAADTPYTSRKLRFSVAVPGAFSPESTDANVSFAGKQLTRDLPVINAPATQLAITGMEVTQGTQKYDPDYGWFQALGSRTDPMPYNGLKLAEDKGTRVRLHVANQFPATVKGVTAVLHGTLNGKALPGSPLSPVHSPEDGVKHGSPTGTPEELDATKDSFWFQLPFSWAKRKTKIDVRAVITPPYTEGIGGAGCPAGGCAADNDLTVKGVPFRATPTLKLRFLKFKRHGSTPKVPSSDLIVGAHQYPIDPARFEWVGGNMSTDATDIVGDLEESLLRKLHTITREVAEDQVDDPTIHPNGIIIGVVDVPNGRSVATLALPKKTPGAMTLADGDAFAHELGHVFAQGHASGCVKKDGKPVMAPPDDDVYPAADWPPDQLGYLQGYAYPQMRYSHVSGFGTGRVLRSTPDDIKHDLMSYCADKYDTALSPRNWTIIGDVMQLLELKTYDVTPASEYTPAAGIAQVGVHAHGAGAAPLLYERGVRAGASQVSGGSIGVLGTLRRDGGITGLSTFPLKAGHKLPPTADPAYAAIARGADGSVVGRAPVEVTDETGHGSGLRGELRAIVPGSGAETIEITRDGVTLATVKASPNAPTVKIISPKAGAKLPRRGNMKVQAAISDADGRPVSAKVEWAPDGRRFKVLHVGDHAPGTVTLNVPAADFAGARSGALRVRVDDGFRSGEATVKRLRAPGTAPQVTVTATPLDGPVGTPVTLRASAFDDRGRSLKKRALEWRLGRKRVGTGTRVNLRDLRAGRHTFLLRARDREGRVTTKKLKVRIRPAKPAFIELRVPERIGAKARFVTVRASTTVPATMTAGGRRYATSRRARSFRVRVKPGRQTLSLTLKLRSGGKRATVRRLVSR